MKESRSILITGCSSGIGLATARYLKERFRSVLTQTQRDLEVLYIDDASTDASRAVLKGELQSMMASRRSETSRNTTPMPSPSGKMQ